MLITSKGNNRNYYAHLPNGVVKEVIKVRGRFYLAVLEL